MSDDQSVKAVETALANSFILLGMVEEYLGAGSGYAKSKAASQVQDSVQAHLVALWAKSPVSTSAISDSLTAVRKCLSEISYAPNVGFFESEATKVSEDIMEAGRHLDALNGKHTSPIELDPISSIKPRLQKQLLASSKAQNNPSPFAILMAERERKQLAAALTSLGHLATQQEAIKSVNQASRRPDGSVSTKVPRTYPAPEVMFISKSAVTSWLTSVAAQGLLPSVNTFKEVVMQASEKPHEKARLAKAFAKSWSKEVPGCPVPWTQDCAQTLLETIVSPELGSPNNDLGRWLVKQVENVLSHTPDQRKIQGETVSGEPDVMPGIRAIISRHAQELGVNEEIATAALIHAGQAVDHQTKLSVARSLNLQSRIDKSPHTKPEI